MNLPLSNPCTTSEVRLAGRWTEFAGVVVLLIGMIVASVMVVSSAPRAERVMAELANQIVIITASAR